MGFPPLNKLTADRALEGIGTDATEFYFRMDRAVDQIGQAFDSLAGMAASWSEAVSFIDAEAAANPGDADWQALLARKNSQVVDFQAMKTKVKAVRDAAIAARDA